LYSIRRDENRGRSPRNIEEQVSAEVVTLLLVGAAIGAAPRHLVRLGFVEISERSLFV